ncbi:uncharacterized protein LOC117568884 [Drosophila albomicans]|uniref:Uncharacterized protein LOC117568884 n=1 Tax=Drosophila albomicans TaxID=7291 RepID=A0A6P8WUA0_DROAB|nr:uncharacterized protein LOC117568884 [Drosophila albomicans]
MARLTLIVFSLVFFLSSSSALITEAMIGSIFILNTILGTTFLDMALGGPISRASSMASVAVPISSGSPFWPSHKVAPQHLRRRRQTLQDRLNDLHLYDYVTSPSAEKDESPLGLEIDIFNNFQNIAHDMASEVSMHLGLPPHTLEAYYLGEKDAPNFEDVVDTVAKRFHAPKFVLAGLHSLFKTAEKYEDDYEYDNDNDNGQQDQ